jgi:hypothetical protein
MAEHLRTGLACDALTNAIAARDPAPGVIFHADRGCQYTSSDYALLAGDLAVRLSTGRTGQCWDNALAESFFASLKASAWTCSSGRPELGPAAPPWTTSPGTTAPGSTAPWATRPRRVRVHHPQGGHSSGSLTAPSALSVKPGQPQMALGAAEP